MLDNDIDSNNPMGQPTIKQQSKAKEEEVKVQEVKKEQKKNKGEKRKWEEVNKEF